MASRVRLPKLPLVLPVVKPSAWSAIWACWRSEHRQPKANLGRFGGPLRCLVLLPRLVFLALLLGGLGLGLALGLFLGLLALAASWSALARRSLSARSRASSSWSFSRCASAASCASCAAVCGARLLSTKA
jgi:hypothetical protein